MTTLTPQEAKVAELAEQGFVNRQIARKLVLSVGSVKTYIKRIRDKRPNWQRPLPGHCPYCGRTKVYRLWYAFPDRRKERPMRRLHDLIFEDPSQPVRNARFVAEAYEGAVQALQELVVRCDGPEGVRPDGSNIDTLGAHAALRRLRGDQPEAPEGAISG